MAQVLSLDVLPAQAPRAAPDFAATDQNGHPLSLSRFRGRVVILSFNDDQCPDLCTLLAQDVVAADRDLGAAAGRVAFVSVNVNPYFPQVDAVKAWTDSHGLGQLSNWYFGTASPDALRKIWADYGVFVQMDAQARSVSHGTELFFIDPSGRERAVGDFGMGAASTAIFAHAMAQMAADLLLSPVSVAGASGSSAATADLAPGSAAPKFRLPTLADGGSSVALSQLRGRPAVINFWTSTCVPCRTEQAALEAAYRHFGGKVGFLGVDVADDSRQARKLAAAEGVTYQLVKDEAGAVAGRYGISGTPYTVILGPTGTIKVMHGTSFTTEQIEYVLESYFDYLAPPGS